MTGSSREINLAAEMMIICCDATFLLKPNRRQCFRCIYCHDDLIQAMVNAVAYYAFYGSFDPPYLDICWAHHEKSISQQR
jgi:hypothetical protein